MKFNDVEIYLLYKSEIGGESSLFEIVNDYLLLADEDLQSKSFLNMDGGIQICVNQYLTLLRSLDFYNLFKGANFLIESMYLIHGEKNSLFNNDNEHEIRLYTSTRDTLILNIEDNLTLSFVSANGSVENSRGTFFFSNIDIDKKEWVKACKLALDEYFEIAKKIVGYDVNDEVSQIVMRVYDAYRYISTKAIVFS